MECLLVLVLVVVAFLVMIFGLGRTRGLLGAALTGCMVKLGGAALVLLVLLCGLQSLLTRVSSSLGGGDPAPPPVSREQGRDAEPPGAGSSSRVSPSGLVYPLGRITDRKSYRARLMAGYLAGAPGREPYFDGSVHLGDDLRATEGDPVYAIAKGKVLDARMDVGGFGPPLRPDAPPGPGGAIVIDHSTGGRPLVAVYGHLKELRVRAGDTVDAGDPIASVGPWHIGVHLHIGLRHGAIPRTNWGLAPIGRVLHDGGIDTLGWQDPCEVLHAAR